MGGGGGPAEEAGGGAVGGNGVENGEALAGDAAGGAAPGVQAAAVDAAAAAGLVAAFQRLLCSVELSELQELNLAQNRIGDGGAGVVADAMTGGKLPNLEKVVLNHCGVWVAGVKALSEAVAAGTSTSLHSFHPEGMDGLLVPLRDGKTPALEELELSHNQVGNRGAKILGEALRDAQLTKLRILKVTELPKRVTISSQGACALGVGLGSGKVLGRESLSLSWKEERPEGAVAVTTQAGQGAITVASALEHARDTLPKLKDLCLDYQSPPCPGWQACVDWGSP
uniref:Uncharacterized protein n=1 Tax=Chromera velia CCMP2878 TaxID=1169474 RepID=A0A0K6S8W6_9ALVE|eukprot:Cvel_27386.t1-p1 / transcript=Cvel_27386.t1 / gene=Cvel_27386 / organism=Chromera_velia_CCMP2878 / gene_product=hypothetical protein / transcript_product=hypothetical protein / location=Cvel_scaffold3409:11077-12016(-) / protein_length=282 / sequence_SO=supercontig / SO=protein_coding / is_pseudo=false